MEIQSYQDLLVWQKAMDLVVACYELASKLPLSESHGLAPGIQRKARQIPSYIADGLGRGNTSEYLSRLSFVHGSLMTLESDLLTTRRLSFLTPDEIAPILNRCTERGKMRKGLMRSVRGRSHCFLLPDP